MVLNGMGQSAAAKKLKVSGTTIRDWVKAAHPDFKIPRENAKTKPLPASIKNKIDNFTGKISDRLETFEKENNELKAENKVLLKIIRRELV